MGARTARRSLMRHVFGWGIRGILYNQSLQSKVFQIPNCFSSVTEYLDSFKWPLLEELRANIESSLHSIGVDSPPISLVDVSKLNRSDADGLCGFVATVRFEASSAESPTPLFEPNDLMIFMTQKLDGTSLQEQLNSDDGGCAIALGLCVDSAEWKKESRFLMLPADAARILKNGHPIEALRAYKVTSLSTFFRTWQALHASDPEDLPLLNQILKETLHVEEESRMDDLRLSKVLKSYASSRNLNESQSNAVTCSVRVLKGVRSESSSGVHMIEGPPGTGKTTTLITLLSVASCAGMRCLVVAPTNVAVAGTATRFLRMITSAHERQFGEFLSERFPAGGSIRGKTPWKSLTLGDVVLVGDEVKLRVKGTTLEDIYLPRRVAALSNACRRWKDVCSQISALFLNFEEEASECQLQEEEGQLKINVGKGEVHPSVDQTRFIRMRQLKKLVEELEKHERTLAQALPASHTADFSSVLQHSRRLLDYVSSRDFAAHGFGASSLATWEHSSCLLRTIRESLARSTRLVSQTSIEDVCIHNASVVFCTVSTAGSHLVRCASPFDCAIIDEAGKLAEAETAILTCTLAIGKLILVGDPQQLPATVISSIAEECCYGRSLMQRLMNNGFPRLLLDTQYRMHPSISEFPNANFYGGRLVDGENVLSSPNYRAYESLLYGPYAFVDVGDGQEESGEGRTGSRKRSKKNTAEAEIVLRILENLQRAALAGKMPRISVGVITPYSSQRELLEKLVEHREMQALEVDVNSIDGFQGQERDVILLSAVRANRTGHIGFAKDLQRLNVAMTRARHCFWIIGHGETLSKRQNVWCDVLRDVHARGLFWTIADDPMLLGEKMAKAGVNDGETGRLFQRRELSSNSKSSRRSSYVHGVKKRRATATGKSNAKTPVVAVVTTEHLTPLVRSLVKTGEFETAAHIYLEKFEPPRFEDAGDCYQQAERWNAAAVTFYNGRCIRKCLDACMRGNNFDMALSFILQWGNESGARDSSILPPDARDEYLLQCAANYHRSGCPDSMMSAVNALSDVNLKRKFLRDNAYIGELIHIEEMESNYVGAAALAEAKGDVLHAVELLEKGNLHADAIERLLFSIRAELLWGEGCKGWGEKSASKKPIERVNKVKALARVAGGSVRHEAELELRLMFPKQQQQTGGGAGAFEKAKCQAENQRTVRLKLFALWNALNASRGILQHPSAAGAASEERSDSSSSVAMIRSKIDVLLRTINLWKDWRYIVMRCRNCLRSRRDGDLDIQEFNYGYFGVTVRDEEPATCEVYQEGMWWLRNDEKMLRLNCGRRPRLPLQDFERVAAGYWGEQLHLYDCTMHSLISRNLKQQKRAILHAQAQLNLRERVDLLASVFEINNQPYPSGADITSFISGLCGDVVSLLWPSTLPMGMTRDDFERLRNDSCVTAILDHVADMLVSKCEEKQRSNLLSTVRESGQLLLIFPYLSESWKEKNNCKDNGELDSLSDLEKRVWFFCDSAGDGGGRGSEAAAGKLSTEDVIVRFGRTLVAMFRREEGWKDDSNCCFAENNINYNMIGPLNVYLTLLETASCMASAHLGGGPQVQLLSKVMGVDLCSNRQIQLQLLQEIKEQLQQGGSKRRWTEVRERVEKMVDILKQLISGVRCGAASSALHQQRRQGQRGGMQGAQPRQEKKKKKKGDAALVVVD